jgi:hypothetical protein
MRRRSSALALLAVAALDAGGCGSASTSTEESSTAHPASGPLVRFEREGGIAFSRIRVVVDRDGTAAVLTAATPSTRRAAHVSLSADELGRLRRLIAAVPLATLPPSAPSGCADCYRYRLAYGGRRYVTDEASIPSRLRPLVAEIESVAGPPAGAGGK